LQPAQGLNAFAFDFAFDVAALMPRTGFLAITFYLSSWISCLVQPLG
jgi:hypothetical protein